MQTDSSSICYLSTWAVVDCCTGLMGILMISLDFAEFFFTMAFLPFSKFLFTTCVAIFLLSLSCVVFDDASPSVKF